MDRGEIPVTHDFYLKKFQLLKPALNYDYILFDEAQDASPPMLDVVLHQRATKVIVGDKHQQIYSWRNAVNAMQAVPFTSYPLSKSFRFNSSIAGLARKVLELKQRLTESEPIRLEGLGKVSSKSKTSAVLARSNLGLLKAAIEVMDTAHPPKHIYFEGNITSYTYADEGASLYDILHLKNGDRHKIKDALIKEMHTIDDLETYIQHTEDVQLGMMLELVSTYGNELYSIVKELRAKHVDTQEKHKANVIFSTVHKCKGLEYDKVDLVDDFLSEEKHEKWLEKELSDTDRAKLQEELNVLYVAITRVKHQLTLPESLFKQFPEEMDGIIRTVTKRAGFQTERNGVSKRSKNSTRNATPRAKPERNGKSYAPWTPSDDQDLIEQAEAGVSVTDLSKYFGRSRGAIVSRLKKLYEKPY